MNVNEKGKRSWTAKDYRRSEIPSKNNKPRRGNSTLSVPCVGACGGLLGLARGLSAKLR
jgi:hypothetical protein